MSGAVEVRPGAGHLPPEVLRLLDGWLPGRRWYPVPGAGVVNVPWLTVTFPHTPDVVVPLLRLAGPGLPEGVESLVVQVPLVLTPTAEPGDGPGVIGTVATAAGTVTVSDGGAHPVCWLAFLRASGVVTTSEGGGFGAGTALLDGARPLTSEQSNTSVVVPGVAGGAMLKILRTVALGPHPDVTIPEALTRAGWHGVPEFLGAVPVSWGDEPAAAHGTGAAGPPSMAHLAVVSRLVTDAHDGFRLACDYAARGEDFGERAHELGAVVAGLHVALRAALPDGHTTLDPAAFVGVLRRRAAEAIADVRELAPFRGPITALYDDVRERLAALPDGVRLQAIHGDLHLGQALYAHDGWKLLDFEGEPQRPVAERTAPDLPLRDVAGLLRSFDYAAAVGGAADRGWTENAQLSFLEGYREAQQRVGAEERGTRPERSAAVPRPDEPEGYREAQQRVGAEERGTRPERSAAVPRPDDPEGYREAQQRVGAEERGTRPERSAAVPAEEPSGLDLATAEAVLRALVVDKALYEVVYETRHRPTWTHIPLAAVSRALSA
ncbi:maltokinase N-terminal cap-like domain-containing protein [Antribacter gilvus]|uniref:maltokinase N-terminal cap-like domain-containing protein n=1 Tax=Antribacter gilvus TaxID=2304675 RepID=UPI00197EAC51|nr:phosphotransferase [Antribacter gilvus]